MTNEQAKVILEARRAGGRDDRDPLIAEALAKGEENPELLRRHEAQRSLDQAIRAKLTELPVPPDLKSKILKERKNQNIARPIFVRRLALAASLAMILALGLAIYSTSQKAENELAMLQKDMARYLMRFPALDLATDQWPDIEAWVGSKGALKELHLPTGPQKYPGLGCREMSWRGRKVLLVCFAAQGEVVHLLILPDSVSAERAASEFIDFRDDGTWKTARWNDTGAQYLMMTRGNLRLLKEVMINSEIRKRLTA